jgi:ribonuclease HI
VKSFPGAIFILLGLQAQKYAKLIDTTNAHVLCWGHPSPLNTHNQTDNPKNFINNTVFMQTNKLLVEFGRAPINWELQETAHIDDDDVIIDAVVINNDINDDGPKNHIWLFTDGGSRKNGKANCVASWGFVIIINGATVAAEKGLVENKTIDGQKYQASNNRGELTAVLNGLNWIVDHKLNQSANQLTIVSDSEYTIKSITIWYPKWKAENKLSERKNIDLIEKIVAAKDLISTTVKVTVRHEYSHTAEPTEPFAKFLWAGNDMADKLCQEALKK